MFASIKRIREMNKKAGSVAPQHDDDGRLVVDMMVRDDSSFISPFSNSQQPMLSTEAADFLDSAIKPANYKDEIRLKIHSDCIDKEEQEIYKVAIKNYYNHAYVVGRQNIKRSYIVSALMLLMSVVFLAAMVICDYFKAGAIFIEIIDIIAWVFVWEAADIFFLQRNVAHLLQHRNIGYYNAEVVFEPLKSKKDQ